MLTGKLELVQETNSLADRQWYSLQLDGMHIWRFDATEAKLVRANLVKIEKILEERKKHDPRTSL